MIMNMPKGSMVHVASRAYEPSIWVALCPGRWRKRIAKYATSTNTIMVKKLQTAIRKINNASTLLANEDARCGQRGMSPHIRHYLPPGDRPDSVVAPDGT